MGVLNVTDNSFSDGGRYSSLEAAVAHGLAMVAAGAAIIDIGGESTRPGAEPVGEQHELERVLPVIEALAARVDAVISIDTMKPRVMAAAVAAGAGMVNDVMGLREPGAMAAVAATGAAVCLMHMQGTPRTMQHEPHYADVVAEVDAFLRERAAACVAA
ncbi:MAG: dihydropteroate synthase, partial [Steroidobacteraceae bacterium]